MTAIDAYQDDYLWDTGDAGGLETIRASLPALLMAGETIIRHGRPRFKAPRKISCPRCMNELRRGKVTIVFRHAPAGEREQQVEGWVCDCGEAYVPGGIAREAYHRALAGNTDGVDGDQTPDAPCSRASSAVPAPAVARHDQ